MKRLNSSIEGGGNISIYIEISLRIPNRNLVELSKLGRPDHGTEFKKEGRKEGRKKERKETSNFDRV